MNRKKQPLVPAQAGTQERHATLKIPNGFPLAQE